MSNFLDAVMEQRRIQLGVPKQQEDTRIEQIQRDPNNPNNRLQQLEQLNADLLMDSVVKDMQIQQNENDLAALIMELVVKGAI
jgi:hypothetical protein